MSDIQRLAVLVFIVSVCICNLHAATWFKLSGTKTGKLSWPQNELKIIDCDQFSLISVQKGQVRRVL
jgi:hypothetical protein